MKVTYLFFCASFYSIVIRISMYDFLLKIKILLSYLDRYLVNVECNICNFMEIRRFLKDFVFDCNMNVCV